MLRRPVEKVVTSQGGRAEVSPALAHEPSKRPSARRRRAGPPIGAAPAQSPNSEVASLALRLPCCPLGDVELAVRPEVDRVGGVVGDRPWEAGDHVLLGRETGPERRETTPEFGAPSNSDAFEWDAQRITLPGVEAGSTVRPSVKPVPERGDHLVGDRLLVLVKGERVNGPEHLGDVEPPVGPECDRRWVGHERDELLMRFPPGSTVGAGGIVTPPW